jgi:phosphoglycolate phosphatase/putative hydrolase of the HAD superfamily
MSYPKQPSGISTIDRNQIKGLLFDVDGTLYRQKPLRLAMVWRLLCHYRWRPLALLRVMRILSAYRGAQEELRSGHRPVGSIAEAQLQLAAQKAGVDLEEVVRCVARWIEQEPLALLSRFIQPGLMKLLDDGCRRGLRMGVVSDYPATEKLQVLGLARYFDVVVIAQAPEVNAFKPDPTGMKVALKRLELAPQEVLYVGDRPEIDAEAARMAGVPCVILTHALKREEKGGWSRISNYETLYHWLFCEYPPVHNRIGWEK